MAFDSAICIFCGARLPSHPPGEVTLRERVCHSCWNETMMKSDFQKKEEEEEPRPAELVARPCLTAVMLMD